MYVLPNALPAQFLFSDPEGWVAIAGLIVGALGFVFGVVYARRRPRLVFTQEGNVVVDASGQKASDIELTWQGTKVRSVSRTRVAVWNDGAVTLHGTSVVERNPVRVEFEGDVLSVAVVARTHAENEFQAQLDSERSNSVQIAFDYLDHDHGGLVDIVHGSKDWRGGSRGTVKGLASAMDERVTLVDFNLISLLPIGLMLVGGVASVTSAASVGERIAFSAVLAVALLFGFGAALTTWRATPPKRLRVSERSTREKLMRVVGVSAD